MPFAVGISCEKCAAITLASKAAGIEIQPMPRSFGPEMFALTSRHP
jgi:hypothetical protein